MPSPQLPSFTHVNLSQRQSRGRLSDILIYQAGRIGWRLLHSSQPTQVPRPFQLTTQKEPKGNSKKVHHHTQNPHHLLIWIMWSCHATRDLTTQLFASPGCQTGKNQKCPGMSIFLSLWEKWRNVIIITVHISVYALVCSEQDMENMVGKAILNCERVTYISDKCMSLYHEHLLMSFLDFDRANF